MRKNNSISLYKVGKFYNAYGDDGLVLHELMGYRFVEQRQSVGFPDSAFSKVKAKLEDARVSFEIYENNNLVDSYKGIAKNYVNVLRVAVKNSMIEARIARAKAIIDDCSTAELEAILEGIENGKFKQE